VKTFEAIKATDGIWIRQASRPANRPMCRMLNLDGSKCQNHADGSASVEVQTEFGLVRICGMHGNCDLNVHHRH
jgi:hypothetical protein